MSTYKVKSNLKHDGKDYKRGDKIELNDEVATPLVRDGVLVSQQADEDEDLDTPEAPQPAVNEVSREDDDVEGDINVEPGTVEGPQPGDDLDDEEEVEGESGEGDDVEGEDGENTEDVDNL